MSWASIRRSSIAAVLFCMVFGLALALAQTGTTSLRARCSTSRAPRLSERN